MQDRTRKNKSILKYIDEENNYTKTIMKSTEPKQKKLYESIVDERLSIYLQGVVIGVIISLVYLYFIKGTTDVLKHSCIFTSISLFVQYIYYSLTPKSAWMVTNLKNQEQTQDWLDVYKFMKYRYHMGMVLGLIGYFLLSRFLLVL
jgi:hypothetical protein